MSAITFITADVQQMTIRNSACICARQLGFEFGVVLSKHLFKRGAIHTPLQNHLPQEETALERNGGERGNGNNLICHK